VGVKERDAAAADFSHIPLRFAQFRMAQNGNAAEAAQCDKQVPPRTVAIRSGLVGMTRWLEQISFSTASSAA
jgi:hypothetical protein